MVWVREKVELTITLSQHFIQKNAQWQQAGCLVGRWGASRMLPSPPGVHGLSHPSGKGKCRGCDSVHWADTCSPSPVAAKTPPAPQQHHHTGDTKSAGKGWFSEMVGRLVGDEQLESIPEKRTWGYGG